MFTTTRSAMNMLHVCLAPLLCLTVSCLYAQERPLILPDRPGLGESAQLVPVRFWQVETGLNLSWDTEQGLRRAEHTYQTSTIRYGLSPQAELRLSYSLLQERERLGAFERRSPLGFSPWSVGFKSLLVTGDRWRPQLAFLGNLALPRTAHEAFDIKYVAPSFLLPMEWLLQEELLMTINVGAFWRGEGAAPDYFSSFSLDYAFNQRLGVFAEVYTEYTSDDLFLPGADAGLVYRLKPYMQFDISAGLGLRKAAADGFINSGLSVYWGR